jgi:DNA-binding NarL/FixJ family response regulator
LHYTTSDAEQRERTDRVAMIRVLLVGDRAGGYATVEAAVSAAVGMVPVGRAGPDAGLWLQLQHARPDVVVIDHEPPSSEKLVLCHRIKHAVLPLGVILHAASTEPSIAAPALLAGADGVVSSRASPQRLTESVRSATRGERLFPRGTTEALAAVGGRLDASDRAVLSLLLEQARVGDIAAVTDVALDQAADRVERLIRHVTTAFATRAASP